MILQIKVGTMKNFCYLVWDEQTRDAAVIDPGFEVGKITDKIKGLGLRVRYILLTHLHFDHATEVRELKRFTNAKVIVNKKEDESEFADIFVKDEDIFKIGNKEIKIIETPGHTKGSVCYLFEDAIFTGDTLFIGGIYGRTDFGGNEKELKESLNKIFNIDENLKVYPGHDYGKVSVSTIKKEKEFFRD